MPIISLLYAHQLAALKAQHALPAEGRPDHLADADRFAGRIATWRQDNRLPTIGWPGHENLLAQTGFAS